MGKTLLGGVSHEGNVSMLTPEQQKQMSNIVSQLGPDVQGVFQNMLGPQSAEEYQDVFQQTYVDPAMQALQQQILPAVQQRFTDANAGSSSALNQALAQSATDVSTAIGSQYGQFLQGQQGMQQNAINSYLNMLGQQTFSPLIHQQQGAIPTFLTGLGQGIGSSF